MKLLFHHVGVACSDLESECRLLNSLGYVQEGEDTIDAGQGVQIRFMVGGGPRLELLATHGEAGHLTPWLKAGTKLYHLAWQTSDLDGEISRMKSMGAKVMVRPVPATAFASRRIAFLMMPNMLLVELIEEDCHAEPGTAAKP